MAAHHPKSLKIAHTDKSISQKAESMHIKQQYSQSGRELGTKSALGTVSGSQTDILVSAARSPDRLRQNSRNQNEILQYINQQSKHNSISSQPKKVNPYAAAQFQAKAVFDKHSK